jgi:hypothetical protein
MVRALAFLLLALPLSAVAAEMCAPNENPYVCTIIEERNNAMNELAQAEGGRRIALAQQAAEQAYWRDYLKGDAEQREHLTEFWREYVAGLASASIARGNGK